MENLLNIYPWTIEDQNITEMTRTPNHDTNLSNSYKRQNKWLALILTQMLQERKLDAIQDYLAYLKNDEIKLLYAIQDQPFPVSNAKALIVLQELC